jgi:hypothetical protein
MNLTILVSISDQSLSRVELVRFRRFHFLYFNRVGNYLRANVNMEMEI